MTAKGLDRKAFFLGLGLALTVAGGAEAQQIDMVWRSAHQPERRVAVQVNAPTVFAQQMIMPSQPVQFSLVPTVVMSDGRVYSNYGNGYQQVVACGPAAVGPYAAYGGAVYGSPTVVHQGGSIQPMSNPPIMTQPVPNQQTRSQQMVGVNSPYGNQVAQPACGQNVNRAPVPVARRY